MLNNSNTRLLVVSAVLTWSVLDCRTSRHAEPNERPAALGVSELRAENARLSRDLARQLALTEQLNARLRQAEIATCQTSVESGRLPSRDRSSTAVSSLEASLKQVDERVEIFPGGPMTPLSY
jgi:hypothetical protein